MIAACFLAVISGFVGLWVMSNLSKEGNGRQRSAAIDYEDYDH